MPGSTPSYGLPYQALDDPPHGPDLGQDLAEAVETELTRVDAELAGVDAELTRLDSGMVRARVKDGAGGTIATTETVEKTLTLAIPTTWVSYDVDVWVMVRCAESGVATGSTTVSLRVRKTNTAGAEWGNTVAVVGDVAPSNAVNTAFGAYAEGETTTGSVNIVFTGAAGSNNGLISWDDLVMTAYAWRTA